ncbi:hypothetical protein KCU93_g8445, partial [Aureobasidium melanogenum]
MAEGHRSSGHVKKDSRHGADPKVQAKVMKQTLNKYNKDKNVILAASDSSDKTRQFALKSRCAWIITTHPQPPSTTNGTELRSTASLVYSAVQPRIEGLPRDPDQVHFEALTNHNEWHDLSHNPTSLQKLNELVRKTPDECDLLIFVVGVSGFCTDRASLARFLQSRLIADKKIKVSLYFWCSSAGQWYDNLPFCKPWLDSYEPIVEGTLGVGRFFPVNAINQPSTDTDHLNFQRFCDHSVATGSPRDPAITGDIAESALINAQDKLYYESAVQENMAWGYAW